VNIGRVKKKGSEARSTLEGYERERKTYGSLVITERTNQSLFGQYPKESRVEH